MGPLANEGPVEYDLASIGGELRLVVSAREASALPEEFEGERGEREGRALLVCPRSPRNAAALRARVAWLRPSVLGLRTSAGLGDRLGLATAGHVRAVRSAGGSVAPIYAQQSIREMARTGRSPRQVLNDAMWVIFAEGWRAPWGADADHLKTPSDIDACVAAGYTFYTFDPGEHVASLDRLAGRPSELRAAYDALPWERLEDSAGACLSRYADRSFDIGEGYAVRFGEGTVLAAAAKYGRAVAHAAAMYRRLAGAMAGRPFEVEVSVDETESPTSRAEHLYIAAELRRLGVEWVSLAPRYVGRFEKGVDYIGDLGAFEADFEAHAAIARAYGPYKLSLHSGSDKFSLYEPAARLSRGLLHLKTAGTSYLEALRTVGELDPELLIEIYAHARTRYEEDRASYHVSAELARAPLPEEVLAADAPRLLDGFDSREILHVTFGSVLTARGDDGAAFRDRLMALLRDHPEEYAADIERHFARHLRPLAEAASDGSARGSGE